ncbi:cysteine hydrolase family protein [Limosilactobacillus antri]|uniref:cysteine hydrolase family protein n=1 Tax=Limosilactobacillus antri TaxID=227943 RepID=UPI001F571ACF|nr:cysteine hydrolase family protein [Limosilactobacillus antri]
MRALLVIDMQNGVCKQAGREPWQLPELVQLINQRINHYHAQGWPVIFIQHQNVNLIKKTGSWQLVPELKRWEGDLYVDKTHPNVFYHTSLQELLSQRQVDELEICGAQTEYCVDATVKMAHGLGYRVLMVHGASSTFDNEFMDAEKTVRYFEWLWGKNFLEFISKIKAK